MTQLNLLELAKQGNVEAIASLMNRQLQSKGITAKVALKNACLQVMLESPEVPDQQALVTFVCKGITGLGVASIERVKIYGRQAGEDFPAWNQEFELAGLTYKGITQSNEPNVSKEQVKQGNIEPITTFQSNSSIPTNQYQITKLYLLDFFKKLSLQKKIALISGGTFLVIFLILSGWLSEFVLSLFPLIIFCLIFYLIFSYAQKLGKQRRKVTQAYENAKEALRKNPRDVILRETALNAGRKYYATIRGGILSIYDEQALANDLSMIVGSEFKNKN
jgi:hypothetical protein